LLLITAYIFSVPASSQSPESKIQAPLKILIEQAEQGDGFSGIEAALTPALFDVKANLPISQPAIRMSGNLVQVVVLSESASAHTSISEHIEALGGHTETQFNAQLQAMMPLDALEEIASRHDVRFVRLPVRLNPLQVSGSSSSTATDSKQNNSNQSQSFMSEGTAVIGSPSWNEAGIDGSGVKVGIIDQFGGYRNLIGSELPSDENVFMQSFSSHGEIFNPDIEELRQSHGTNVGEIIYDIAPGASHYLAYIETGIEFQRAINWLIQEEVDVINTSLGFESGCPQGGGIFEPVIELASESGISWATSAGNEAATTLQIDFSDSDEDQLHNFGEDLNANRIDVLVRERETPDGERFGFATLTAIYNWDVPCIAASNDYELVVSVEEDDELVELVEFENFFNDFAWGPGRPIKVFSAFREFDETLIDQLVTFHIGVRKRNPEADDVNISINHVCTCRIEHISAAGSVGILEPAISPNTFTVAAAHHSTTACPRQPGSGFYCPDGRLLFYSSQGPTLDGRIKPDISGPTHVSTATSGQWTGQRFNQNNGFGGTSGASPHVAGAMALIVQALTAINNRAPDPDDVFQYIVDRAEDLGEPGFDNAYGHGLLTLAQPPELPVEGELIVTKFLAVTFPSPQNWTRELISGCVHYTNISSDPSLLEVTKSDGEDVQFEIPAGNLVLICGDAVHIDMRAQ